VYQVWQLRYVAGHASRFILSKHPRDVGSVFSLPRMDVSEGLPVASITLKPPTIFSTVHGEGKPLHDDGGASRGAKLSLFWMILSASIAGEHHQAAGAIGSQKAGRASTISSFVPLDLAPR